jgi:hypothetical protein
MGRIISGNNILALYIHFRNNVTIKTILPALMAHTYNPSYSGSRDQDDHSSRPAWANSSRDPILKTLNTHTHTKRLVEWLKA